jgi:hypothetical protein
MVVPLLGDPSPDDDLTSPIPSLSNPNPQDVDRSGVALKKGGKLGMVKRLLT